MITYLISITYSRARTYIAYALHWKCKKMQREQFPRILIVIILHPYVLLLYRSLNLKKRKVLLWRERAVIMKKKDKKKAKEERKV